MRSFLLFITCFLGTFFIPILAQENIYIVLTHPRATATAFERIFRENEDLTVLHAPFLPPYMIQKYGADHPFAQPFLNGSPQTFEGVQDDLCELAKERSVFFKESAYLLLPYMKAAPEFFLSPTTKIVILVRDPAKSILSYYKKLPSVTAPIVGHQALWETFVFLSEKMESPPLVIDSDLFLQNPLPILDALGQKWGLTFTADQLEWESGYAEDWHWKEWYADVANSTGLGSYRGDVLREDDGTPAYLEVENEADRQRLQEIYRSQAPYYQLLLEHALQI